MTQTRQCGFCCEPLGKRRVDAKFCDDRCRAKAASVLRKCKQCNLHHPSVTGDGILCTPCRVWDMIQIERKTLVEIVAFLNERRECFYCGELATEDEHVVPRWLAYPTWVVRSCRECNGLAGGEPFVSALEKAEWIKGRRAERYSHLLKMPDWSPDELEEIGHTLRKSIIAHMAAKDVVKSQLSWNPLRAAENGNTG